MALSYEIISQFAKVVNNDKKQTGKETTVYGVVISDGNGNKYVKLDGSDQLTPLSEDERPSADSTVAATEVGDRVSVSIKNHTATVTGNISSPSVRSDDFKDLVDNVDEINKFDIVLADKVQANEGYIKKLQTDKAEVGDLKAATAKITELEAGKASIDDLKAAKGEIEDLKTKKLDADVADLKYATIENLKVTDANVESIAGKHAQFEETVTKDLTAVNGSIKKLDTDKLSAEEAKITYAQIDFSNIGKAAIEEFYAKSGIIQDLVIGDTSVTGRLVGVTIIGDLIEGGTVKADKLVILGNDGLYYKLNTNGVTTSTEQTEYNSLNGSIFTAKSITAEKVDVHDLVAFNATIGGFKITDTSIYSGVKNSITNPTRGLHIDKTGQLSLGDSDEYLRYYENDDGDWILEISSSSVKLSTTGKTVEEEIEGIKNDMNGRLTDVETRVTHAETSLEAHDNAISLKASTETVTDISNKTNELDKALEDAKTVIQENRDAIATLTARDFKIEFTTIMEQITALNGDLTSYKQEIGNWMRFDANGNLVLGATRVEGQDAYELKLTKNRISFMLNDVEVAYISSNNLYITNSTVVQNLKIGRFVWEVRGNGNLGLMYR